MNGNNYELPEPPEFDQSLVTPENGRSTMTGEAVMILDPNDIPDQNLRSLEVDAAYGVKPFYWKDTELAPFAIDREGDWMRHRELLGEPVLSEILAMYRAMLPDALRVIWFCIVEPSEWLKIPVMYQDDEGNWYRRTAQERALLVEDKIREWAQQNVSRTEGPLAVDLFYEIFKSAQSTRAVAKPSEHQREDKLKN